MSLDHEERINRMEGVRDQIVDTLTKGGLDKLSEKELTLLEKTINNGTKVAFSRMEAEARTKSEAGELELRQAATAYIVAQRELGNRRVQAIREGAIEGGNASLPAVEKKELLPNEGLQGQFQVGYEVLSGEKAFNPSENLPPPARDSLPQVP